MNNAIEIRNVSKSFGPQKVAVSGLSLEVPSGSLTGFIGPNGAGKTTTIRMIMSIIFPDSGELSVLGRKSAIESKDRIGYLPEERGVYRKMKAGAFIEYIAKLKGVDSQAASSQAKEWMARVGLGDVYFKKCQELSKGMQQKVQFISSVIHKPDLLILDEPFSGLDPVNSRLLRELIDEQSRRGCTIIFSTHQMLQAEALCDRIVMVHQGIKRLDMTPAQIAAQFDPRTIIVEPIDPADGEAMRSLERLAGVSGVTRFERVWEVSLREGVDAPSALSAVAGVVRARKVEVRRVTLEDIFIEIVEGKDASNEAKLRLRQSLKAGDQAGVLIGERGGD